MAAIFRLLWIAVAALVIGACDTIPVHRDRGQAQQRPEEPTSNVQAIPLEDAAGVGSEAAQQREPQDIDRWIEADLREGLESLPPYRQGAYLDAARKLIDVKRIDSAQTVLDNIDVTDLAPGLRARKRLLQAEIHFDRDELDAASRFVNSGLRVQNVDPQYISRGLDLKARIELRQEHPLEAAKAWIRRDNYLADPDALADNHERIWLALGYLNELELQLAQSAGIGDDLRGWLDLAILFLDFEGDSYGLRTAVTQWSAANRAHPGAAFATELLGPARAPGVRQIALLLPLSSNFGAAAQSVYNGFEAARQTDSDPSRPQTIFYDVGGEPSLAANYVGVATSEGADVVVGPLGKSAVNALLESRTPQKPMVLLGSSSGDAPPIPRVYQFDLAQEAEAEHVAEFMYASGHRRVAALYARDEWGQRIFEAFAGRWRALGGTLAEAQSYPPDGSDFTAPIKNVLNLIESENREAFLQSRTGLNLEFEARRRQDVDALFIAARPEEARQLKPQINFYQGLDLPVYSTSHVYTGTPDRRRDADLDGIIFPDMPWVLRHTARVDNLKSRLQNEGYSNVSAKLFAFGFDAYRLALVAPDAGLAAGTRLQGLTSRLEIRPDGRIRRHLEWARFKDGIPVRVWTP